MGPPEPDPTHLDCAARGGCVVGIGASAGGLEALERFFSHCPADTGAAFVVVQHLSPDHKSMMLDLLARYTAMPVVMVDHGMRIAPDRVFLIPAGKIMRLAGERFELTPKTPHVLTLPIDIFFASLADARGRCAIGIVLSGTGSDGSRGALAINAADGFLMAQDPKTAKFDGMPASVISTGLVDAILAPQQLPGRLLAHIGNGPVAMPVPVSAPAEPPVGEDDAYAGIVQLLLHVGGIDFDDYKRATVVRRLERRMQVRHLSRVGQYYGLLKNDRQELAALKRELLIPVTNFFRDPESFAVLEKVVIERLVAATPSGATLRVWVAGSSTGEEAYSIAMLFLEAFERERRWPSLKIFATDVSQESIDFAAAGAYPEATAIEITRERLERFFSPRDGLYVVKPELRQTIVFAKHNLLADPPFTQMDLVSCRNTLIYFVPDAQERVLQRLQFATRPHGFLFLGSSEALSGDVGFEVVDSHHKLFRRASGGGPVAFGARQPALHEQRVRTLSRPPRPGVIERDGGLVAAAGRTLLDGYAPPSMLVNARGEVVHLFGEVQPYFQARAGTASLALNRVLPPNLVAVASALMLRAARDGTRMLSDLLRVEPGDGGQRLLRLAVTQVEHDGETALLLSFEEQGRAAPEAVTEPIDVDAETLARVEVLERELGATRESLQATIEALETANEELQATNEELMASNEELQSSNEELQSVNEELNTVNAEYQEKVGILNRVNADLESMAKAVAVATVFVDHDHNLTRFSPDALGIFKLRDSDIGRPLDEIRHQLDYPALMKDLDATLRSERMVQKEVDSLDGRHYLVRMLPYRVSHDRHGAVATFVDVTALRDRDRLQLVIDALPEHIAVLANDGSIVMVNRAWRRFARANGSTPAHCIGVGANYLEACLVDGVAPDADAEAARHGIKAVLEGGAPSFSLRYPCHSPTERRWFVMNVAPVPGAGPGAVVSHFDISTWYAPD